GNYENSAAINVSFRSKCLKCFICSLSFIFVQSVSLCCCLHFLI
ncbi:hypothetical protein X975_08052, partial [Stegodyphus mimosarum]